MPRFGRRRNLPSTGSVVYQSTALPLRRALGQRAVFSNRVGRRVDAKGMFRSDGYQGMAIRLPVAINSAGLPYNPSTGKFMKYKTARQRLSRVLTPSAKRRYL